MAFGRKLAALVIVFVFAAGASAATCDDGSSVGSNGCCAATNECPPCPHQLVINTETNTVTTPSAQNTTCRCYGCAGETVTIDPTCTHDSCDRGTGSRGSGPGCTCGILAGCDYCSGPDGTCMPNAADLSDDHRASPRAPLLRRLVSDAAGTKASSLLLPIPFVSALASMQ